MMGFINLRLLTHKLIKMLEKLEFSQELKTFVEQLQNYVSTEQGQWSIKGFIDVYQNIYTISADTKVISKVLEIHIFPKLLTFAEQHNYKIILATHQNYYPDMSFVHKENEAVKFAVDFKTTYRHPNKKHLCNGFTLGSHGKYFEDRNSSKNIQFPYSSYLGHFCLGIIYDRIYQSDIDETCVYPLAQLSEINSVIGYFQFFVAEKWKIASDKSGSGNTANIGSIHNINDILHEKGMFSQLGERWFDDYWMNYNKITITDDKGNTKKIKNLKEYVEYRKGDTSLIVTPNNKE